MIEKMGGKVFVESVLGEGTIFSFDIRTKAKSCMNKDESESQIMQQLAIFKREEGSSVVQIER